MIVRHSCSSAENAGELVLDNHNRIPKGSNSRAEF
jgi:hypothetical protein